MLFLSRVIPIGEDVTSWNLSGTTIAAIRIDNTCGSWLKIEAPTEAQPYFVPPYTIGWTRNFVSAVEAVSILFVTGPVTASSTIGGTNPLALITEEQLPHSDGYPFIATDETEVLWAFTATSLQTNNFLQVNPTLSTGANFGGSSDGTAPPPGRRLRLFQFIATYENVVDRHIHSPVEATIRLEPSGTPLARLVISEMQPTTIIHFTKMDLPVGGEINIRTNRTWQTPSGHVPSITVAIALAFGVI